MLRPPDPHFNAKKRLFVVGIPSAIGRDMKHQVVNIAQMKEILLRNIGSKFPFKITLDSGEQLIRYLRGFADASNNIVLTSETSYSLAMKIVEVKDIRVLEFASEDGSGNWTTLHAKWLKRPSNPLPFFAIVLPASIVLHNCFF